MAKRKQVIKKLENVNCPDLPVELWIMICLRVKCPITLLELSRVNKELNSIINNKTRWFWNEWKQWHPKNSYLFEYADQCGITRSLSLMSQVGCELCGKKRIRKVYPFGIRCCEPCLHENTICDYYLPVSLQKNKMPLPFNERSFPSRGSYGGGYTARFYWKSQVVAYVFNTHQQTLEEYKESEQQRLDKEREENKKKSKQDKSVKGKILRRYLKLVKNHPNVQSLLETDHYKVMKIMDRHVKIPDHDVTDETLLQAEAVRLLGLLEATAR